MYGRTKSKWGWYLASHRGALALTALLLVGGCVLGVLAGIRATDASLAVIPTDHKPQSIADSLTGLSSAGVQWMLRNLVTFFCFFLGSCSWLLSPLTAVMVCGNGYLAGYSLLLMLRVWTWSWTPVMLWSLAKVLLMLPLWGMGALFSFVAVSHHLAARKVVPQYVMGAAGQMASLFFVSLLTCIPSFIQGF